MEIGEKADFQINFMKNSFIPLINKIKQQIKKCQEGGEISEED